MKFEAWLYNNQREVLQACGAMFELAIERGRLDWPSAEQISNLGLVRVNGEERFKMLLLPNEKSPSWGLAVAALVDDQVRMVNNRQDPILTVPLALFADALFGVLTRPWEEVKREQTRARSLAHEVIMKCQH